MSDRPTVAVLGGGVAGLVAARALNVAGARAVVIERQPYLGGRCHRGASHQFEHAGERWSFDLEHGIHGIWRQYRNLRRLLGQLGREGCLVAANAQELVVPHPGGGVRAYEFGARVRNAPLPDLLSFLMVFAADDFLRLALAEGPGAWARSATDLLHAFAFDARRDITRYDDVSVADFIAGWPLVLQRMSGAITHSAFFREAKDVGLSAYLTGLQSYFISDKRDTAFDVFARDAAEDLLFPLRSAIADAGGGFELGCEARALHSADGRARSVAFHDLAGEVDRTLDIDGVVIALDPPAVATLRAHGGLERVIDPGAIIPEGVSSCVVRLFYDRDCALDRAPTGVFHGLPADNFFWLHRLQRRYVRYHARTGGAVLECHLYGDRAAAATTRTDDAIVGDVVAVAEASWPELAGALVSAHLLRNAATHVAFGKGVMARVPTIATRLPNVAMAGDWIAVDSPTLYLERAVLTALVAAKRVGVAVGLAPGAFDEPIDIFPPSVDVAAVGRGARWLRDRGLLPALGA